MIVYIKYVYKLRKQHVFHQRITDFRTSLGTIHAMDWISVPLVYTQVVNVAVCIYFIACLMARQSVKNDSEQPDYDFGVFISPFTVLELIFYVGWLKTGAVLLNPLGEDDDDFDINFIVDKNVKVGFIMQQLI
jgi:hypothetical protein